MRASLAVALLLISGVAEANKDAHLISYGGYATMEVAVVRGRVARGKAGDNGEGASKARKLWRTTMAFFGRDVEHAGLRIISGGRAAQVVADDEGFFEARLPGPLPAGKQRFQVLLESKRWQAPALELELDVVDGRTGHVIITDMDDTLIATGVTGSKASMVKRMAMSDARDIQAFEGAAETLSTFVAQGVPVVYLSASPVELGERLLSFLALRGFPAGAIFLRHYEDEGIGNPTAYKQARFAKVLADFPGRQLILFGDNGEKDPEIFAALARDTGRVAAIYIRQTLAVKPGEARYEMMQVFSSWREVLPLARAAGIVR